MARRIEVELTSSRDDGTWTWRAANARQPKGEVSSALLYPEAKIGDVIKVEAEFHLDGIEVTEVFPPKAKKERTGMLEMVSRPLRDDELVTEVRTGRRDRDDRGGGRKRRDGGGRGDGGRGGGGRGDSDRSGRRDGAGRGRDDAGRGKRKPSEDSRPTAKRLRPGRVHRNAALEAVPEEHRPIAEQVLKGGLPAVRAAIEKQNTDAATAGSPQVEVKTVLAIAEPLVSIMNKAEWHDRADAALAELDELELRDLRSVVSAADPTTKDETARAKAEQLRTGLNARLEKDQAAWLTELSSAIEGGRTIRALRLSSRPVKAGAPIPAELATKLTEAAAAALTADIASDRWAAVVDALAYSPIRAGVTPAGYPAEPTPELLEALKRIADRIPTIAAHFGIDPMQAPARKRPPRKRSNKKAKPPAAAGGPAKAETPTEAPAPEAAEAAVPETAQPAEPVATEPESPEPVATEPMATEPVVPEPVAPAEPAVAEEPAPEAEAPEQSG